MGSTDPGPTIRKRFTPKADRVKTWTEKDADGNEQSYIRVPVSSTSQDRDGDEFTGAGLKNLKSQYDGDAVALFLDHGASDENTRYATRGILGKWESAEREGDVLYAKARLNRANEDVEWLREYLDEGMPVGFSVGFRALEYDGDFEDGFQFDAVDLLETSAVGIPSNPDGVAAMAADESEWRKELDQQSGADDGPGEGSEDKMGTNGDDDNDDDQTTAELLQRVLDQQDEQIDALEEKVDDLADQLDKEDGSDDEEDDEDDEDDDEDDDKSVTLVAGADASEETLKEIAEMREVANDNGEVELDEAKTTMKVSDEGDDVDEQSEKSDGTVDNGGWL